MDNKDNFEEFHEHEEHMYHHEHELHHKHGNDCGCEHHHEHDEHHHHHSSSKIDITIFIISVVLFIVGFIPAFEQFKIWIYLVCLVLSGFEVILGGLKSIFKFEIEEDTLMAIAAIAAFVLGEFPESCAILLLFKLGEFIEEKAEEKSEKNIEEILDIKPQLATLVLEDGKQKQIKVEEVNVGDRIIIKPGDRVPVDCTIIDGETNLDVSAITGESKNEHAFSGNEIISGAINLTSSVICKVNKQYKDSMVAQIIDLVGDAKNNKGKTEKFITKFAKIYTPIVVALAVLIAVIPTILGCDVKTWILRALIFIVASCPCSMVISIPLAFFSGVGAISKKGMLIKGTKHLEKLASSTIIAFDKTGTLTTGKLEIAEIVSLNNYDENTVLKYMYSLEKLSNHPISTAIVKKVDNIQSFEVKNHKEIAGHGVYGIINDKEVLLGNKKLLNKYGIEANDEYIYLAIDKKIAGYITVQEEIRDNANNIKQSLDKVGIKRVIMLSGDNVKSAKNVSDKIGIDEVYASLLPNEKLEKVKELKKDGNVIFVGDGINDSPVLADSSFGISMGEGTEIANSVSDGILISNNISQIPFMIKCARKTMGIVKFNIIFSILIKIIVLVLGIIGIAPIWMAVFADTGTTVLTVVNSLRIFKSK